MHISKVHISTSPFDRVVHRARTIICHYLATNQKIGHPVKERNLVRSTLAEFSAGPVEIGAKTRAFKNWSLQYQIQDFR
jgi:hypothetical protein